MTMLRLDPDSTLHFSKSPAASQPSRVLKITNVHPRSVAFKVKTTSPKSYLVRPSFGTLKPHECQEVHIILQPQGSDGLTSSHRFLVQAFGIADGEGASRDDWNKYPKESIQEQRLNVVIESVEESQASGAKVPRAPMDVGTSNKGNPGLPQTYDDLVNHTLSLEKEKKRLEASIAKLQGARSSAAVDGFSKFHIVLVALVAFLLPHLMKFIS